MYGTGQTGNANLMLRIINFIKKNIGEQHLKLTKTGFTVVGGIQ